MSSTKMGSDAMSVDLLQSSIKINVVERRFTVTLERRFNVI
jgi:hypothetical protein